MGQISTQNSKYYKVDEVANFLGVSITTIYRDINANRFHPFKRGRILRISSEDLDSYINHYTSSSREEKNDEEINGGENE